MISISNKQVILSYCQGTISLFFHVLVHCNILIFDTGLKIMFLCETLDRTRAIFDFAILD